MKDKPQVHASQGERDGKAFIDITWDHFNGSVLDMPEVHVVFNKASMIKEELSETKSMLGFAQYKMQDMHPRKFWSEMEESSREHMIKLTEALELEKEKEKTKKRLHIIH